MAASAARAAKFTIPGGGTEVFGTDDSAKFGAAAGVTGAALTGASSVISGGGICSVSGTPREGVRTKGAWGAGFLGDREGGGERGMSEPVIEEEEDDTGREELESSFTSEAGLVLDGEEGALSPRAAFDRALIQSCISESESATKMYVLAPV